MSKGIDQPVAVAYSWHRASRTVAPALAVFGGLFVVTAAVRRLNILAEQEARLVGDADIYAVFREDATLFLLFGLAGAVFGLMLAFWRSGRWGWSIGLAVVGLVVLVHWGRGLQAIPFLAAAVLAWVADDSRLHPTPDGVTER